MVAAIMRNFVQHVLLDFLPFLQEEYSRGRCVKLKNVKFQIYCYCLLFLLLFKRTFKQEGTII